MAKNSRARGRSKAIAGNIKQNVGKLIGNPQMEADGAAEEIRGEAEEDAAKASERVVGAGQELSGTIKRAAGDLTDDPELSIEGQAEANRGKHRQEDNQ
jgi:uncharacterized protein YjbJ (UPF0337 family)